MGLSDMVLRRDEPERPAHTRYMEMLRELSDRHLIGEMRVQSEVIFSVLGSDHSRVVQIAAQAQAKYMMIMAEVLERKMKSGTS